MPDQCSLRCNGRYRCTPARRIVRLRDELAVVPVHDSRSLRQIPEVAARRLGHIVLRYCVTIEALIVVASPSRRVMRRDRFLRVISHVRSRRPVVPVRTYLGTDEESVENSKPLGQRVMIGRYSAWEKDERRVSVGLRQIAEHLIVCAVFLDDVNHMLEWGIFLLRLRQAPADGRGNASRESIEVSPRWYQLTDDRQRAVD